MTHDALLPVYDERKGRFASLRGERVLVYWPHGFGDFVHFGYVVPALHPSNTYFLTRFGDDFVHLYDGARGIAPIYSGIRRIGDGHAEGTQHLGINWKKIRNRPQRVVLPDPLQAQMRAASVTSILYTDYPEREGRVAYPFHTKARQLIRSLVDKERLSEIALDRPLPSALRFEAPPEMRARIEERLRSVVASGQSLYLITPAGHTTPHKAWPRAYVDEFCARLRAFDPHAVPLVIEESTIASLFGDLDVPFAHVLTTLIGNARATVGVPAGPLHAAMAMRRAPVVGIWLAHHPNWYDEYNPDSLHFTGPLVHRRGLDRRKASVTVPPHLRMPVISSPQRIPEPGEVLEALAGLLR